MFGIPVGKIAEKAVCKSVFLIIKTHSFRLFLGDFAHWDTLSRISFFLRESRSPKGAKHMEN